MILSFPVGVVKLNTPSRTERLFQKEETRVIIIIPPSMELPASHDLKQGLGHVQCCLWMQEKTPTYLTGTYMILWTSLLLCAFNSSICNFFVPFLFFLFFPSCSSVLILGVFLWLEKEKLFSTLSQFPEWWVLKISEISQYSWESYSLPAHEFGPVVSSSWMGCRPSFWICYSLIFERWFVGSLYKGGTMICCFHLVPHFEGCSATVTVDLPVRFLRTSWNISLV
jgi:hypothetical protein